MARPERAINQSDREKLRRTFILMLTVIAKSKANLPPVGHDFIHMGWNIVKRPTDPTFCSTPASNSPIVLPFNESIGNN